MRDSNRSHFYLSTIFTLVCVVSGHGTTGEAVADVVQKFENHQIVAIGDSHGLEQLGDFYLSLLSDSRFLERVDFVSLEMTNSANQQLVDQYTSGAAVDPALLKRIFYDAIGKFPGPFEPILPRILATVRQLNLERTDGRQLRVLLAEPPFVWNQTTTRATLEQAERQRDAFAAELISKQVINNGLRALVIAGESHLVKTVSQGLQVPPLSIVDRLEQAHPGSTYTVLVHNGLRSSEVVSQIEKRLGGADAGPTLLDFLPEMMGFDQGPNVLVPHSTDGAPLPTEQPFDAFLYLAPASALRISRWDSDLLLDEGEYALQSNRHRLLTGLPLNLNTLIRNRTGGYLQYFRTPQASVIPSKEPLVNTSGGSR